MKRNIQIARGILLGMMIFVIFASACNAGKNNQDPPKFFVHKKDVSVGNVYEGQDIDYTYKVRNNGVGELHIINVRPG